MADSYVCSGATMRCTMGEKTAKLTVLPSRTVFLCGKPMANISDHKSMVNLAPFGRCRSLGYPATAAATAAHHGHLTPMPCVHNTPIPWMSGKKDNLDKTQPALLKSCKLQCMWGGMISFVDDGQVGEGSQYVNKSKKTSIEDIQFESNENNGLTAETIFDGIQTALDVAGFIPAAGAIPDLLNASIYVLRGRWLDAGVSIIAAVPLIGDAAAGVKIAKNGFKIAKNSKKVEAISATSNISNKFQKDIYRRPSGFRAGVRKEVWETAKAKGGGKVFSPEGIEIKSTDKWDMGHRPGYEFRKHKESASQRGISRKQFLDEHNNPDHYRPETPSYNRKHLGEDKTDLYLGP